MSSPQVDLSADVATLTRALCDIPSVSGDEQAIADAVTAALGLPLPRRTDPTLGVTP